jgi:hypothetical protein
MVTVSLTERKRAETGLAEAYKRLTDRIGDPAAGDPVLSLAETLTWCYALEEHLRQGRGGNAAYFLTRDADPDGQALAGLMYARGLVTHSLVTTAQLVDVLQPPAMRSLPGERGGRVMHSAGLISSYRWKPLAKLPLPGRPEKNGRDAFYDLHVADRPLVQPLFAAMDFLLRFP